MKTTPISHRLIPLVALLLVAGWSALGQAPAADKTLPPIPEDLLDDDHIREEFGINEWTTPSIGRVFDTMTVLGTLSYDDLRRPVPERVPGDRIEVSLGLGALIADGFLVVQCEKIESMEDVGRAMIKFAKALGAGTRMNRHTQSLLENSVQGDWQSLRVELAKTQADVEAEMLQLRDVEIAHLISLGGWLRGLEISSSAIVANYSEAKSSTLSRRDIVEYYLASLENLQPSVREKAVIQSIHQGLSELLPLVAVPEGKAFTPEEVSVIHEIAKKLAQKL
jgi:hypothetical protein